MKYMYKCFGLRLYNSDTFAIYMYHTHLAENDTEDSETLYIDGLGQERRNSSASAMELRFPCTNTSI